MSYKLNVTSSPRLCLTNPAYFPSGLRHSGLAEPKKTKKLSLKDGGEKEALYFDVDWPRILSSCFLTHFSMEGKEIRYFHLALYQLLLALKTSEFSPYILHSLIQSCVRILASLHQIEKQLELCQIVVAQVTHGPFFIFFFCKGYSLWGGE